HTSSTRDWSSDVCSSDLRVRCHIVWTHETPDCWIIDAGIEVYEADGVHLFLVGETTRRLRGDGTCRIRATVGIPSLAPRVVRIRSEERRVGHGGSARQGR